MMAAVSLAKPRTDSPMVWLSPEQVCERVPGMTTAGLQELRKKRQGPRYFKPTPKKVVYSQSDIDEWVAASVVATRGGAS